MARGAHIPLETAWDCECIAFSLPIILGGWSKQYSITKLDEKGKRKEKEYEQFTCGVLLPQCSILTPWALNESTDIDTAPQLWKWYILPVWVWWICSRSFLRCLRCQEIESSLSFLIWDQEGSFRLCLCRSYPVRLLVHQCRLAGKKDSPARNPYKLKKMGIKNMALK